MIATVYKLDDKRSFLSKRLTVNQVFPIAGQPSPLAKTVLSGSELYLHMRTLQTVQGKVGGLQGSNVTAAQTGIVGLALPEAESARIAAPGIPTAAPPISPPTSKPADTAPASAEAALAPNAPLLPRLVGAVSAGGVANTSLHLMTFGQDVTHAQVVGHLQTWGLQGSTANSTADTVFELLNTHGAHAVFAGVTVGSATVAFLGVVSPRMQLKNKLAIGAVLGLVVGLLIYFVGSAPNPFTGKWVASPAESRYEFGTAPQAAICTITAEGNRLNISEDRILRDGTAQHLKYQLNADSKDHAVPRETGADTAAATQADRTLDTVYKLNGKVIRREVRLVSPDQKEMTVTVSGQTPNGGTFKNVSQYEKK
jgi:hypothetical protein